MREYETVFILHPKVDDAGIDREIESVKQTIADGKGELVGVHKWGRKKLAYPIRKATDGFYILARFHADPPVLAELDRKYKINEQVLRHLTVLASGEPFPPDLRGRERRSFREAHGAPRGGRRRGSAGPPRGEDHDEDNGDEADGDDVSGADAEVREAHPVAKTADDTPAAPTEG